MFPILVNITIGSLPSMSKSQCFQSWLTLQSVHFLQCQRVNVSDLGYHYNRFTSFNVKESMFPILVNITIGSLPSMSKSQCFRSWLSLQSVHFLQCQRVNVSDLGYHYNRFNSFNVKELMFQFIAPGSKLLHSTLVISLTKLQPFLITVLNQ